MLSSSETFNSSSSRSFDNSFDQSEFEELDQAFETYLIYQVKKAEPLYCSDSPDFNNAAKNRLEWLMIAEKCRKTVPECISKWYSLLRTYFSLPRETSWIHRSDFSKFEPHLTHSKLQTPTKAQRDVLVKELLACSSELMTYGATTSKENSWLKVVSKCNAVNQGVIMSSINWQKYWLYMKQNLGVLLYKVRSKYETTSNISEKFTEEELNMITICHATPYDSVSNIIEALGNNLELGPNRESVIFKCRKCGEQKDGILLNGLCSNCCETPKFCNICEIGGRGIKYQLSGWSKEALDLLPTKLSCCKEITLCSTCSSSLKKEATLKWKICRVCQVNKPDLESLYADNYNNSLRKAFKDAIKYQFHEDDGLPGYICKVCKAQVSKLVSFVNKFKRGQNRLWMIHLNNFIGNIDGNPSYEPNDQGIPDNSEAILPDEVVVVDDFNYPPPPPPPAKAKPGKNKTKIETKTKIIENSQNDVIPIQIISTRLSDESTPICDSSLMDSPMSVDSMPPIAATESEIAIKNVFSLQQNRPKLSAVPVAAVQFPKLKKKQIGNVSQYLKTFSKLKPATKGAGGVSTKTINKNATAPPISGKVKELIKLLQTPQTQPDTLMKVKPTKASKPAIFTISELKKSPPAPRKPPISSTGTDFEALLDAPPVFCIPKLRNDLFSDTIIPSEDALASPPNIIKTEIIDDDNPGIEIATPDNTTAPPTPNVPTFAKPNEETKIVRMKGVLVTVKPHPYILGAWTPVGFDGNMSSGPLPGQIGSPVLVNSKIKNTQVAKAKEPSKVKNVHQTSAGGSGKTSLPGPLSDQISSPASVIPQIKTTKITEANKTSKVKNVSQTSARENNKTPPGPMPVQIGSQTPVIPKNKATTAHESLKWSKVKNVHQVSAEGKLTLHNPEKRREQRIIKKPRRYWGTVDEFQVSPSLTAKKPPQPRAVLQQPSGYRSQGILFTENLSNVEIKEEIPNKIVDTNETLATLKEQNSIVQTLGDTVIPKSSPESLPIKKKKLRINIRQDQRVQQMLSKYENKCSLKQMESVLSFDK